MVTTNQYTSIKRVLDNLLDHPMLRDVTLEQAVRYTLRFISLHGYPQLYEDKVATIVIKDFKGLLPCDLISIIQVKDLDSNICLRSMTDTFTPSLEGKPSSPKRHKDLLHNIQEEYIPPRKEHLEELTFKTQGRVIYTSFPVGKVEIAYKSIPVDEDGFPLLIDNETYLNALEAYIKLKVFTVKFDTGKIQAGILSNAQADYAFAAHELNAEMCIPSVSEMESITRMLNTMIKPTSRFDQGFKYMGDREYRRRY
jgi:hypothetical protein